MKNVPDKKIYSLNTKKERGMKNGKDFVDVIAEVG
jgi:hypothetical protein